MPSFTLSLDQDLLDCAKEVARREHVSLNRLVHDVLIQRVAVPDSERLSLQERFSMADSARTNPTPFPYGRCRMNSVS